MLSSRCKPRVTRSVLITFAVVTPLATGVLAAPPALAGTATARTTLTGTRPSWASTSSDAGTVPADTTQSVRVYLAGSDPGGLADYALAVCTPGDADYRHYLTPGQFERRFGPTAVQTSAVEGWLAGAGLHVTAANAQYVAAGGSGSQIAAAFGTTVRRYRTAQGRGDAPTLAQDLDTYSKLNGLPQLRTGQLTENLPSDIAASCPPGPATESTLDVDAVHTMAPGAGPRLRRR